MQLVRTDPRPVDEHLLTSTGSLSLLAAGASMDLHAVMSLDGTFRWVSEAGAAAFGWRPSDLVGQRQTTFIHLDDQVSIGPAPGTPPCSPGDTTTAVFRFRCGDGSMRWSETVSRVIERDGEVLIVSDTRDIGDRRRSESDLRRRASTDPLTGAANRTVFMDHVGQALLRLERRRGIVAVLVLDVDRFKDVNDSFGHLAGDHVLLQLTERLRSVLRPEDTLARLGGDEFAVLTEDMTRPEEASALAARLVASCHTPFEVEEALIPCTSSIGVVATSDAGRGAHALVQDADLALYRAKGRGRDRAEAFDDDLRTRALDRLGTERMVRRAVKEDRLRVALQPIIDLRTGSTLAAEALVRISDPGRPDPVAAETFIDVARETGLLSIIDEWMLSRAVDQVAAWRSGTTAGDPPKISLNVTARRLADPGFVASILQGLADRGLSPGCFSVEVTEHVLMAAAGSALDGLRVLREEGVEVGLDNFGTGLTSISWLRRVELDFVKLDRVLVHGVASSARDRAVVGSIVELAHALDMQVVAQGVEDRAQANALAALGCDRAQGYFFGELASVPVG